MIKPTLFFLLCAICVPALAQKHISLQVNEMSLNKVVHLLAKEGDLNIIIEPGLDKSLTLDVQDVTPKQALNAVVLAANLQLMYRQGVYIISSEWRNLDPYMQTNNGEMIPPLFTKVIHVRYADAKELQDVLNDQSAQLISKYGSLLADERSNSLIIKDTKENLAQISGLIDQLDSPVQQVLIEARIVIMEQGQLEEFGVRWGVMDSSGATQLAGSLEGITSDDADLDDLLNVDLGASDSRAASAAFQIASLGEDILLDLELSALQAESRAEIISSPRLLTTNNKTALIEQGTEIPYQESSDDDSSSIAFRKAVLSLEVTPQITPDRELLLDLSVSQDKVGTTVQVGSNTAPSIDTQHISTQVLIGDGETLVLGGIYQQQISTSNDEVPGFADLPVIGSLFRYSYTEIEKSELIIFVTPSVLSPRRELSIDRL